MPNRTGLAEPDRFETETEPNRLYREWNRIEPLAGQDLPEQFWTGSDRKDNDSEPDRTGFRFLSIGTGLSRIALFLIWTGTGLNRIEPVRTGLNRFGEPDRTGLTHETSLGRSGWVTLGREWKPERKIGDCSAWKKELDQICFTSERFEPDRTGLGQISLFYEPVWTGFGGSVLRNTTNRIEPVLFWSRTGLNRFWIGNLRNRIEPVSDSIGTGLVKSRIESNRNMPVNISIRYSHLIAILIFQ